MEPCDIKQVTLIGVGLLGGSVGLAIKAYNPQAHITGVGRRQSSLDAAMQAGAIDRAYLNVEEPVSQSDLVILSTPVGAFEQYLKSIKPYLKKEAMVTDVGSTKASVVRIAERILGRGGPFVGSHPMAGSEHKGVAFARADLFSGATCIVTPTPHTPEKNTRHMEAFWMRLGMKTLRLTPSAHDRAVARVSHLPHALASLLMMVPADKDIPVSATGFRDATRLAGGDPEMWRDIFLTNRNAVLAAMDQFDAHLLKLRALIENGDGPAIEKFLARSRQRREETIAKIWQDRNVAME